MAVVSAEQESMAVDDFVSDVRDFMRDFEPLNTLIEGEEHNDRLIYHAIYLILDDFNASPPPIGVFCVANFPNRLLLLYGVVSVLLESAGLLYARNDLAYAHSGTQVQFPQASTYPSLSAQYRQRYEQSKREWKVSENARQALAASGGTYSTLVLTYRPTGAVRGLGAYARFNLF